MKDAIWTISSLVGYLKNSLENDMVVQSILVRGEISNFTAHRSGHLYFSLKDQGASMNCVMFASQVRKLKIQPKEGMKVIARIKVSVYEARGSLQLYVLDMQSDGIGDLYLQFEALKKKLHMEGLFDPIHKKQLPTYPMNIGIISAKTGAAIQDVLSIISRRWPLCEVKVYPTLVQGMSASTDIIRSLKLADENNHDVILLVRGGGSLEDLYCFNDELLARTIFSMKTCIVSGVGHETDTTLVDYVSDLRAPTPSAAAELITPDLRELKEKVIQYKFNFEKRMVSLLESKRQKVEEINSKNIYKDKDALLDSYKMRLAFASKSIDTALMKINDSKKQFYYYQKHFISLSEKIINNNENIVLSLQSRLFNTMENYNRVQKEKLHRMMLLLDAYSPLKVLERGYSIVLSKDKAIRSVEELNPHDKIDILLKDGIVKANVLERNKNNGK